jgi:hypothetical protein
MACEQVHPYAGANQIKSILNALVVISPGVVDRESLRGVSTPPPIPRRALIYRFIEANTTTSVRQPKTTT